MGGNERRGKDWEGQGGSWEELGWNGMEWEGRGGLRGNREGTGRHWEGTGGTGDAEGPQTPIGKGKAFQVGVPSPEVPLPTGSPLPQVLLEALLGRAAELCPRATAAGVWPGGAWLGGAPRPRPPLPPGLAPGALLERAGEEIREQLG